MAIPKWSRRQGWAALALAAICALALLLLVGSTAMETGKGLWAALFLLALGALAAGAALFATEGAPMGGRRRSAWLQPRPIALVFVAIFVGFGVMTDALALFEPRPAVESKAGAIERGVNRILTAVAPEAAAPARIGLKLPGIWGEPGCAVSYRFRIESGALLVDSVRRPAGTAPHHLVATITSAEGDVLNATGEQPEAARGKAATFTYVTNGVTERLTWDDRVGPVPLELDRCG